MSFIINLFKNFFHNMLQLLSFGKKTIKNSLSIYIKTNTGSTLAVDLNPKWDIKNVKELVAPQLGMQPEEVKIIFAGKELSDNTIIEDCDLGQQSILHAVKSRDSKRGIPPPTTSLVRSLSQNHKIIEEDDLDDQTSVTINNPTSSNQPFSQSLVDLQLENDERQNIAEDQRERTKAHFYVHCSQCKELCPGKLRVQCSQCHGGAFTVHRDPENWDDVLKPRRIRGHCESFDEHPCIDEHGDPPFAAFYFKCSKHPSGGEKDYAAPLSLIKINIKDIPCLACTDITETVLVFPCEAGHVTCLDCFRQYCSSRLMDRQFLYHPQVGYTLACPAGCENSFVEEIHHFKLLTPDQYDRYQRFATEEFVLQSGGVLCPQPGCGMGLLVDEECKKVTCQQGCGFVFCRSCLQGYHLGECIADNTIPIAGNISCEYAIDPEKAATARWDEASKLTIKVISKPCPKCRTPTERAGGCMHMVCIRSGCGLEWCWVCQTEWTRDCMGAHWFG